MGNEMKSPQEYFEGRRSEVADLVPNGCQRVLDVGCGYGGLGVSLRARGVSQIFGIEINPSASPKLDQIYSGYWIGDVEQVTLPSDIELFDCLFSRMYLNICAIHGAHSHAIYNG